jgi:penicillin-binding protein 1A
MRRRWRIAATILGLFLFLFAWLAITAPLSRSLQPIAPPAITLLSAQGTPIARQGAIIGRSVDVAHLPAYVPNAFIAIEDRRFYNHSGIDPWGIIRAAIKNAAAGHVVEGGSTISQQLAKISFLSSDRTPGRKIQEAIMAVWLEAWLTKDEILSRYMSSAYFGDNVYGLRAAARHYFSRDPENLTIEQAAMLAGLMKAPSRLAPTDNLKGARARAQVVLGAMVEQGMIDKDQEARLPKIRLKPEPARDIPAGTYFADWAFPQARAATEDVYGEQEVRTTLEDTIQRAATRAIQRAGPGKAQVALVAMRPDGRVVAMVGGKSYKASPFNRATQARRQPGSTFKLFVYLAALREGMTPDSIIEDEPLTIGDWSPRNSNDTYRGPIPLREAFAISSNVAAVRLSEKVGRENVIRAARDLGVSGDLHSEPSLALGTSGVSLIEMAAAYAAIANGSYPVTPRAIVDKEEKSWLASLVSGPAQLGSRIQKMMLDLLWQAANAGTGRAAALRVKTYGKTGTSQDNRDAIFIGFAGDLVTAIWVGNDDNSPLKGIHGGGLPARIWRDFMSQVVAGAAPPKRIEPQEDVSSDAIEDLISDAISSAGDNGFEIGIDPDAEKMTIRIQPPNPAEIPTAPPPNRGPTIPR